MSTFRLNTLIIIGIFLLINVTHTKAQTYCTPSYVVGCGDDDGIAGFTLNNTVLSASSGCSAGGYQFYNLSSANVTAGQTYNFTLIMLNSINDEYVSIWIDADKDGIFSNAEMVLQTTTTVTTPYSSSFAVPISAIGSVRMRIRVRFEDIADDPCQAFTWGETEDYMLTVACPTTQNIAQTQSGNTTFYASGAVTASNIINSSANITYSAGTSISLQPGFSSEAGSVFLAKIGTCPN